MAYRDIVVHLGEDGRSLARLDAAIGLAALHQGRVTGAYVAPSLAIPEYAADGFPPEFRERLAMERRERAQEAEREFRERTAKAAAPSEWRLFAGDPIEAVTTNAHRGAGGQRRARRGRSGSRLALCRLVPPRSSDDHARLERHTGSETRALRRAAPAAAR